MTKKIAYIRVSTDKQDYNNQKLRLLEFAQTRGFQIDEFIAVEVSSRKSQRQRRIQELLDLLSEGDTLLVTELSRLGRNMVEVLNIVTQLGEQEIEVIFTNQPELSTTGVHGKLLMAIYGYLAEVERDFISVRTKQGLARARSEGKVLGRPKGAVNKSRLLDPYRDQIAELLGYGVPITAIKRQIDLAEGREIDYKTYRQYVIDKGLAPDG